MCAKPEGSIRKHEPVCCFYLSLCPPQMLRNSLHPLGHQLQQELKDVHTMLELLGGSYKFWSLIYCRQHSSFQQRLRTCIFKLKSMYQEKHVPE